MKMRKYGRLLATFFRACIVMELEYRAHFWANVVQTLMQLGIVLLTLSLFFAHTRAIGGWSFWEVLVLLGVFTTLSGFVEFFLRPNLGKMVEYIQQGTLDFVLTKPVDSQFFISFRYFAFFKGIDVLLGLATIGAGLAIGGQTPGAAALLYFGALLLAALAIIYSIWLALMTTAFWFVRVDNLHMFFHSFFEAGRYPVTVYRPWLRFLLTYVVPIAFITTVPSASLTGRLDAGSAGSALVAAAFFLALTRWFWRRALRYYTSASS
jgi:ABC-2 type transport system permease protein